MTFRSITTYGTCGIRHQTARVAARCRDCTEDWEKARAAKTARKAAWAALSPYQQRQRMRAAFLGIFGVGIVIAAFGVHHEVEHSHTARVPVVVGMQAGEALNTVHAAGFLNAVLRSCDTGYGTVVLAVTENGGTGRDVMATKVWVGTKVVLWCDRQFTLLTN